MQSDEYKELMDQRQGMPPQLGNFEEWRRAFLPERPLTKQEKEEKEAAEARREASLQEWVRQWDHHERLFGRK